MLSKKSRILCVLCSVLLTTSLFVGCNSKVNNSENNENAKQVFENLNEDVNGDLMMDTIKELTSKKYNGRLTGTEGNRLATEYIKNQFEELELDTLDGMNDYLQYYTQMVPYLKGLPKINIVNKDGETVSELKFLEDFLVRANPEFRLNGSIKGEIIYLKDKNEFNENKENLEGKIVIISSNLYWGSADANHFLNSGESKALGIILENNSRDGKDISFKKSVYVSEGNYESRNESLPLFVYADINATNILKEESKNGNLVELNFDCYVEEKSIANVIGIIPGTDEKLKDDYIIISGHFDHLGDNYDGTYNPGASDNASGIASMLEIARSIKTNNIAPKRPILFIAFNGEENGLFGSKYFVENSGLDMKNVTMINIDMIANKVESPLYIGSIKSSELSKDIIKIAKEMGISYKVDLHKSYSDHTYIEENGGQAVSLIEYEQEEYHTPDDTIDIIEKADLEQVLELVLRYISTKAF